ncbi:MFS transporter [Streptomyces phaeochromogenes]
MSLTSSTTGGASSLDDAPVSSFHRRIMVVAMGGPFCDGYLLGVMGVALGLITPALALDTLWTGLTAASVLVGVFIGGAVFGPITDRVGRHLMYVLNLATFVVFSALQFFVTEAWQLLVLRLLIGIAIGADYPIASALTTELVPRRMRGPALSGLVLAWWVGYGVSYWVGWALTGLGDDSWRWMLASGTVPALIFLFMRAGIPESPRWLASRGRMDEAKAVVRKHLGQEVSDEELLAEGRQEKRGGSGLGNLVEIFKRGYTVPVVFCSVFWICQVAPAFAVRSFHVASDIGLPELLYSLRDDVRLQRYVEQQLGRLVQHDARHGSDLLSTLREYLVAAGNKSIAAKHVGLSRQAFYQRLRTIERLLGNDLESGAHRTQLHVAVTALDVLGGAGGTVRPASL